MYLQLISMSVLLLAHWGLMTSYVVLDIGLLWFRLRFVAYSTPGHYLNQWRHYQLDRSKHTSMIKFETKYCMFFQHDDVIKWKHFPRLWPVTRSFYVFFDLRPNKRLSKQQTCFTIIFPLADSSPNTAISSWVKATNCWLYSNISQILLLYKT